MYDLILQRPFARTGNLTVIIYFEIARLGGQSLSRRHILRSIIEEYELTVDDIFPQKRITSSSMGSALKAKGVAKYQNRIDPSLTWTGKGRKPEWVITFLANGGTLEELEIKSN
ncbi:H-NS histone family protein [Zoogloea oleivorans]|uniref:H-NS histone family protein n=1 Tax=Zoogloea oleivorans TaxID=1552750 RepID=A0A6C2C3Z3_9RHOO|nr:H-NS histone family protein [Zoogloea oleivorans]